MTDQEDWLSDSSQAVEISIVQAGQASPNTLSTFHPKFTYPIFGEEERIFGYKNLRVHFRFAAHDLSSNVQINYDRKLKPVGNTKALDVEETLKDWIPSTAFDRPTDFDARLQHDSSAKDFKPPGELIDSYTSRERDFEIWSGELTDPAVQQIISRIQIFISFFIEGGMPLDLDDEEWTQARWRVFFLYEKLPPSSSPSISSYSIVGYSTTYRFLTYVPPAQKPSLQTFTLPPPTPIHPASLPSRARISQFVILPPHQQHSHGRQLFNSITRTFLADPTIFEITVEDPNEAFDDLRDYCDYARLRANDTFSQITLNTSPPVMPAKKRVVPTSHLLDVPLLDSLRRKNKLAPRQFYRLVELYLLSLLPPYKRQSGVVRLTQRGKTKDDDDRAYYYWRLLVKQRVYKKNRDLLIQLARSERIEKVEETVGEVAGDYERLLRRLEGAQGNKNGTRSLRRKRKAVLDDEDEDDDDEVGEGSTAKRRREMEE
ncbi:histone acetyltransferase 1 [Pseudocyphellaria aurata]|nr:histone acetyltransferase 1 [Pseudocyphellaria aurata]